MALSSSSSLSFNGEILEIFSRLPAKSLIRFQSVCKDAKSYLSQTFFLKHHSHNMLANQDSGFLLVHPHDQVELYSSSSDSDSDSHACFGIPPESVRFLASTYGVMASSNGLVCGRLKRELEGPVFICNPVTKSWVLIPLPDGWNSAAMEIKVVFECLNSVDYVLMIIAPDSEWSETRHHTRIYSPKEGEWKVGGNVIFGTRNMHMQGKPVFINSSSADSGEVYFMSDSGTYLSDASWPYVVRYIYDVKTSISQVLKIPEEAREGVLEDDCKLNIFKWVHSDDSDHGVESTICLIKLRNTIFTVWVLEDSEWRMIFKTSAWDMGLLEHNLNVAGFTVMNGNQLVIATAKGMYRYDLTGDTRPRKAQQIYSHGCGESSYVSLHPYSNTLRPCGDGARPLPI